MITHVPDLHLEEIIKAHSTDLQKEPTPQKLNDDCMYCLSELATSDVAMLTDIAVVWAACLMFSIL